MILARFKVQDNARAAGILRRAVIVQSDWNTISIEYLEEGVEKLGLHRGMDPAALGNLKSVDVIVHPAGADAVVVEKLSAETLVAADVVCSTVHAGRNLFAADVQVVRAGLALAEAVHEDKVRAGGHCGIDTGLVKVVDSAIVIREHHFAQIVHDE